MQVLWVLLLLVLVGALPRPDAKKSLERACFEVPLGGTLDDAERILNRTKAMYRKVNQEHQWVLADEGCGVCLEDDTIWFVHWFARDENHDGGPGDCDRLARLGESR